MDADVIIVGAGLAGLVAARELTRAGKKVLVLDQENAKMLGIRRTGLLAACFWLILLCSAAGV